MDYGRLLALAADLGYVLLESGAEIYRVEEAIQRLLHAYGVEEADPFVIPNCIIVSMLTPEGTPLTQVRRMPSHGTDVDLLERCNDLCRALCREVPPLDEARQRLEDIRRHRRQYPLSVRLLAYMTASAFFALFFGGSVPDALAAILCGLAIGTSLTAMGRLGTNSFFKTVIAAFLSALIALGLTWAGLGESCDRIIIAALMALVPGIIFTNALRDLMAGDLVASVSKIADALLTGVAVALGTAFALGLSRLLWGALPPSPAAAERGYLLPVLSAAVACAGYAVIFNIRRASGVLICAVGGALGWLAYLLSATLLHSEIAQSFVAAIAIAAYSEIMARVRKCPVTGYLLVAFFPLVPGGGIYYTMVHAINGETQLFLSSFLHTLGIAGALAIGVLLVSSAVRMGTDLRAHRQRGGARP